MPTVSTGRPQLQIVTPPASPEEAAAVIAAVDRFLRDTTWVGGSFSSAEPAESAWTRAARREGVDREPAF
jgi:hypothetical protein